jgi:hypothetical protein
MEKFAVVEFFAGRAPIINVVSKTKIITFAFNAKTFIAANSENLLILTIPG